MKDSNTPIVLVICNDYGELAFALYLLANQPFAQNTTLMLPPRLYEKNPDALPGRTQVYHSLGDVQAELEKSEPGILGLFSGYLLPIHRLCTSDELAGLLGAQQKQGWTCFTSDPFLGLLDDVEPAKLVTFKAPRFSVIQRLFAVFKNAQLAAEAHVAQSLQALTEMRSLLQGMLHVYPCGETPKVTDASFGARLHFHNPAFFVQPDQDSAAPDQAPEPDTQPAQQRWLFVLGDQDYEVQEDKYRQRLNGISRRFRQILLNKLHETLEAGRMPTLIAPAKVIDAVRKYSPTADNMELLPHCEYSHFQTLLRDAEYVFYWNAVSFSCILRTLTGKPWFTFDDGHLLRGMNADYAQRISDWFYRGDNPPRLDINTTLTCDALLTANQGYLKSSWRIRQGLLGSPEPQSLFSALDPSQAVQEAMVLVEAVEVVEMLGEIVSANALDGSFVVDAALLSYPKAGFSDAVQRVLERGTREQAAFARSAAPTLAFFQPGVGPVQQALESTGPQGKPWRVVVEAEMRQINQIMAR